MCVVIGVRICIRVHQVLWYVFVTTANCVFRYGFHEERQTPGRAQPVIYNLVYSSSYSVQLR